MLYFHAAVNRTLSAASYLLRGRYFISIRRVTDASRAARSAGAPPSLQHTYHFLFLTSPHSQPQGARLFPAVPPKGSLPCL